MKASMMVSVCVLTLSLAGCGEEKQANNAAPNNTNAQQVRTPTVKTTTQDPMANAQAAAVAAASSSMISGPMKPLIDQACQCKTAECGSQVLDQALALVHSGKASSALTDAISALSACVMSTGIDKNEFITKIRQLRQSSR